MSCLGFLNCGGKFKVTFQQVVVGSLEHLRPIEDRGPSFRSCQQWRHQLGHRPVSDHCCHQFPSLQFSPISKRQIRILSVASLSICLGLQSLLSQLIQLINLINDDQIIIFSSIVKSASPKNFICQIVNVFTISHGVWRFVKSIEFRLPLSSSVKREFCDCSFNWTSTQRSLCSKWTWLENSNPTAGRK